MSNHTWLTLIHIWKVYFNSLLATLNARGKLQEGFFGDTQHLHQGGAYHCQMSRLTPKQADSFGSTTSPGSPTLGNFKLEEKVWKSYMAHHPKENSLNKYNVLQGHRSIAVNVQTITDYHVDTKHTDSYSPVLPLWHVDWCSLCESRLSRFFCASLHRISSVCQRVAGWEESSCYMFDFGMM